MPTREETQVNNAVKSITDLVATLKESKLLDKVVKKLAKEEDILFGEKPKKEVKADAKADATKKAEVKKKAADKTTNAKKKTTDTKKDIDATIADMKKALGAKKVEIPKSSTTRSELEKLVRSNGLVRESEKNKKDRTKK